ncbi:MAG: SPFH domain-containing protein [Nitrospinota bacterium]|jgi:regulator of protease activity HflC (stomatin/prohibitin superfamily)|nr:SPFH domain-containing protein [Nitrospinota bacterium]MDP7369836.1 SPFH domain-containing protein [Nitrospinota bacterium]
MSYYSSGRRRRGIFRKIRSLFLFSGDGGESKYIAVSPQDFVVHTRCGKQKTRGFGKRFRYKSATDEFIIIPTSLQRQDFNIELTSSDNLDLQVYGFAQWRIISPDKTLEQIEFQDWEKPLQGVSERLGSRLEVFIRKQLSSINLTDIFNNKNTLMKQIEDVLASAFEPVGVSVSSFTFQALAAKSPDLMKDLQAPA